MQTHRLFEIIYLLLDKKQMTASQLAQHFEVSPRTIYRDIDRLSLSGIPIYTNVGKNGGITLMEGYTLDKSLLTHKEHEEILLALQSLKATEYPDAEGVLKKLGGFLSTHQQNWIEVDFTDWGSSAQDLEKFNHLKKAILDRHTLHFTYHNTAGKESHRRVDPLRLLYKGRNWYLQGFCHKQSALRVFKMFRIQNLKITADIFEPHSLEPFSEPPCDCLTNLSFIIDKSYAYRVYDEFTQDSITLVENGDFHITTSLPANNWLLGYLLSFGSSLKLLEPSWLKERLANEVVRMVKAYGFGES